MELPEKSYLLGTKDQLPAVIHTTVLSWEQIVFTVIVMLPTIAAGMTSGFAAIVLPELTLTTAESAWLTSIPTLSAVLSITFSGLILDKYGRKITILFTATTLFIGFLLTSLSSQSSLLILFTGQFFCGLAQGCMTLSPSIYVTESIAPDNLRTRSSLSSWIILAVNLGICLDYILGAFFHYTEIAMMGAVLGAFSFVMIVIFIPESPAWLHQKGHHIAAVAARKRISFQTEPLIISPPPNYAKPHTFQAYVQNIKRRDVYKPLIITTIFFFFLEFSGQLVFVVYMVDILTVSYVQINAYNLTVVCGALVILSQVIYILSVPYIGLKTISALSCCGTGSAVMVLAATIGLNQYPNAYSYTIDCIHIVAVWLSVLFSGPFTTTPFTILGEVFPADVKGFGALPMVLNSLFYFVILWIYSYSLELSKYYIYFFFAAMNFVGAFYIRYIVPETVGKTLQEISNRFSHA